MKLFDILLFTFVQTDPIEQSDKTGISTAAFDEYTPNDGKIGCGRGTIVVTKVWRIPNASQVYGLFASIKKPSGNL